MIKELIINRSCWSRGDYFNPPKLINENGNACCLGFLGFACNISYNSLYKQYTPHDLGLSEFNKFPGPVNSHHNKVMRYAELSEINDDKEISEEDREKQLTQKFKELFNIDLIFKD